MNDPIPPSSNAPQAAGDLALYDALLKADRSGSLAPLAAGLAQELNDLLARILGAVTLARANGDAPGLAGAEAACLLARDTTRRLLALAEPGEASRTAVPPGELLAEAAKVAGAGNAAEITVDAPESVAPVWVDRADMLQALQALVRTSVEAMTPTPPRPQVQLRAADATLPAGRVEGLPAGDYVEIEVRDNGVGIPPENLQRIWEPFFTTRKHASGLGLPAALATVRRHGGQIGVDSAVGVGTVFTLFLPRARQAAAVAAHRAPATRFRTGRILVMDDDAELRAIIGSMLEALDYKCDLARDGEETVDCYRKYLNIGRPYDAVILDLTVSGGRGGADTFARLRLLDPDVRAIASSGGDAERLSRNCLEAGFCGWLAKPYRMSELAEALQTILG